MKRGDTVRFKNWVGIYQTAIVVKLKPLWGQTAIVRYPPQDSEEAENLNFNPFCVNTCQLELSRRGKWLKLG